MPVISVSVPSLPAGVDATPLKIADGAAAQDFLALLSGAISQSQPGGDAAPLPDVTPQPAVQPQAQNDNSGNQSQNAQNSSAGSEDTTDVTAQPAAPSPPDASAQPAQQPALTAAPRNKQQNKDDTSSTQNTSQTQASQPVQPVQPPQQQATASAVASGQDNTDAIVQAGKQLRTALQSQLGDISQILQTMLQAMAGTAPQANASAAVSTPQPGAIDPTALQPASGNASAADAAQAAAPSPDESALLKDIQSILQQMQQSLQPSTGQDQPAQDALQPSVQGQAQAGGQDTLQTLADSLLKDMGALSQLLKPPAANATAATDTNASSALTASAPQLGDLGAQLKTDIAQVRNQLKALSAINDTLYAAAQANQQAAPVDPSLGVNALPGSGASANTALSTDSATVAANAASVTNAVIPSTPVIQASPVIDNTQIAAPVAAVLSLPQGSADTSGGNSGNNGQQQAAPAPVAPAGAGQVQSSSGVNNASFTKALSQAAQSPVLEQVTFQVKTAVADGSSKIHIQLDPADLGKLDIKLSVDADGKTGVVITADNKTTLGMLQQDTQGLTRALNAAGLTTDSGSLSFNLRNGQQQGQGQGGNPQAAMTYQKTQPDEDADAAMGSVVTRSYVVNLAEGLDIRI